MTIDERRKTTVSIALALGTAAALGAAACHRPSPPPGAEATQFASAAPALEADSAKPPLADAHAEARNVAYLEAARRLPAAALVKPSDRHEALSIFALAPLLVLEAAPQPPHRSAAERFGAVIPQPGGTFAVDLDRPTVYYAEAEVHFGPVLRRQVAFVWFYPPADASREQREGAKPDGESSKQQAQDTPDVSAPVWRAVRVTLAEDGFPIIAEALADSANRKTVLDRVFVSKRLESAAAEGHGPAMPGRRFAVEPPIDDAERFIAAERLIVAGTIDDAPMAMGPMVYLAAGSREVFLIICRCSPSQVEDFVENLYYDLAPLASIDPPPPGLTFDDPSRLDGLLRLPELP